MSESDEIEIVSRKGTTKKERITERVVNPHATTAKVQRQIAKLVTEGKPVPNDLRMQLAFAMLETIEDDDKKLRGLLSITKTFKAEDVGMDDTELARRTPKSVLRAIATAKGNNMKRILADTE